MDWVVYILECADGTLYTGVTNDMDERLAKHVAGTGAKYTRGRGPFKILHTECHGSRSEALKREIVIKALGRDRKLALVQSTVI